MKTIKLFEAFAGVGSQYKALKNISKVKKWNIKVVGIIEWYLDAIIVYLAIHHNITKSKIEITNIDKISLNSKDPISKQSFKKIEKSNEAFFINKSLEICNNLFDITKVTSNDMPKNIDIFTYSFPCQDLSQQGKQEGIKSNTRSGLLFQVDRILHEMNNFWKKEEMPKYLILENVKNIISKKHIHSYKQWLNKLKKLGYESKTYVLNSSDFGSSQNRIRIFCVSVRKDFQLKVNFNFSNLDNYNGNNKKIKDILEKQVDEKYYLNNLLKYSRTKETKTKNGLIKSSLIGYTNFRSEAYIYNINGKGPTLTASGANSRIKIIDKDKIRMLTPLEAYLYMGFTKYDYKNAKKTNLLSDIDLIYTAGNSIPIQVLEGLFSSLKF